MEGEYICSTWKWKTLPAAKMMTNIYDHKIKQKKFSRLDCLYRLLCSETSRISTTIPYIAARGVILQTFLLTSYLDIQILHVTMTFLATEAISRGQSHAHWPTMGHWQYGEASSTESTSDQPGEMWSSGARLQTENHVP